MKFRPLYQFSMCFQYLYPYGIFRLCPSSGMKVVYITFDDGPVPEVTPQVLDILARYKVKATFFMVGENVDKHPDLYRRVLAEGHSVGNHTYHHVKGMRMRLSTYLNEVRLCEEAFTRQQDVSGSTLLFRPPYGRSWWWQRKAIAQQGYRICLWDVLTHDYSAAQTPEKMMDTIRRYTRNGSIINFHDSVKSNQRMLSTLPQAIEWLQAQGYTLLPL